MPENLPPMLTLDELCDRWDIAKSTFHGWRQQGRKLPPRAPDHYGRTPVKFLLSDVEAFEAEQQGDKHE